MSYSLLIAQVWDVKSGLCIHTLRGHTDEILDVVFNTTVSKIVTASADGASRIYNTMTGSCDSMLAGHEGEISKVTFNPQGTRVLTASADKTSRIWDAETGDCLQVLEGHTDEIFSCAFNYEGDTIITGSKDNTCRIWKCQILYICYFYIIVQKIRYVKGLIFFQTMCNRPRMTLKALTASKLWIYYLYYSCIMNDVDIKIICLHDHLIYESDSPMQLEQ